jgi:fatty acid desaturase
VAAQTQDPIKWYRVPIARDELRSLTKRSDIKAAIQTLGFFAILAATFTAAYLTSKAAGEGQFPIWGAVLLVFLHGTCWAFLLQPFHELVHYTVFKTRWLGSLTLYVVSFLSWFNPFAFRASHTRHHLYTLHQPRDREVTLPRRISLWDYFKVAIVDPVGILSFVKSNLLLSFGRIKSGWQQDIFEEEGPAAKRRLINWARFLLLGHAAIVIVSILSGEWMLIVLITLARFYGRWLQFFCNESQHIGLQDNVPDFRLSCRTFTLNPIVRFLHWHMNYHIEHHMYAAVPCYNLRRLHKRINHTLSPWTTSILATWKEIASIQRLQKYDPTYQHKASLPPKV